MDTLGPEFQFAQVARDIVPSLLACSISFDGYQARYYLDQIGHGEMTVNFTRFF